MDRSAVRAPKSRQTMSDVLARLEELSFRKSSTSFPKGYLTVYFLEDPSGLVHEVKYTVFTSEALQAARDELYCVTCGELLASSIWDARIGFISDGNLYPPLLEHLAQPEGKEPMLPAVEIVRMIKDGLAPELLGLNEEEPELALRYALELLREWKEKLEALLRDSEEG